MRNAVLAGALALLVALAAFTTPVAAASGTVSVQAAIESDVSATTLEFTFTASQNGTVTVGNDGSIQTDGGNVHFEFTRWSGGGDSGTSGTWEVTSGTQYTVEYEARASTGATETQHSASVSVNYESGSQATSESLYLDVRVLEPAFGSAQTASGEVVFEGSTASTTVTTSVPNTGDGVMLVEDVTFSGLPSGFSASASSVPDRIQAGESGSLGISVSVDGSVAEGTYTFDATVTDSLGNQETFPVEITVSKPPIAGVEDGTVHLGDVLVGQSKSASFQIQELGGYQGLDGLNVQIVSSAQNGDLSVDVPYGFSTEPGGSGTVSATVTAGSSARQHETLQFELLVSGQDRDSPERRITATARVIYPAKLGSISASPDTLVFDEPRSQVSQHTQETTVRIANSGDLEMDVTSVTASVSEPGITASVEGPPSTVPGVDSKTATVRLAADPSTPEGTYTVRISVETAEAGSRTITREFSVEHETDLAVQQSDVQFGEVTITDSVSKSIDVAERLGYQGLNNVTVSVVEGPEKWLTISSRPPETLQAGESAPLVFDLKFDTEAEAYQQYTWKIRVDAENVEAETITVSATAQLLSVEGITSDLQSRASAGGWKQTVAQDTITALSSLEDRLRSGKDVSAGDIWRSLTIGQSTIIIIDSVEAANQLQANGNYEAAQSRVVSALVAQNLVEEYVAELDGQAASQQLQSVVSETKGPVSSVVEAQKTHYESVLASEDATALERYSASSNLAELERHQGNTEQAKQYARRAEKAFSTYQSLVTSGTKHRRQARTAHEQLASSATLTVLGQPIVANPARLDSVRQTRQSINEDYQTAIKDFREAGATAEAAATAEEAAAVRNELQITMYALYGFTAVYAVVFVLFVYREASNARTYVRESTEAASGDFLL